MNKLRQKRLVTTAACVVPRGRDQNKRLGHEGRPLLCARSGDSPCISSKVSAKVGGQTKGDGAEGIGRPTWDPLPGF